MADQMKRVLEAASGKMGAPAGFMGQSFYDAQKKGWLVSRGYPQNSTTCRYGLTDAGREALRAAA